MPRHLLDGKITVYEGIMKHKKLKIAIVCILSIIVAFAVLATTLECFYLAKYLDVEKYDATLDNLNTDEIRVMSSNLRCFAPLDLFKKSWFYRAELVLDTIKNNHPDIIGFQEVNKIHYDFMQENLVGFDNVIDYRDKAVISEGCAVFYRKDKFDLIDKGSFWLSKTPYVMSKDWGSAHNRVANYVILQDKNNGKQFVVFNTHLDHKSEEARINGIQVVLDKIEEFGNIPSLLMGDLNDDDDSTTYQKAVENFDDVQAVAIDTMDSCTYQGWGSELDRPRVDYMLVSKTGFSVLKYEVDTTTYDGVYASDHFPLIATLKLE